MVQLIHHTNLHRTAKYFMDNGRAASHDEALNLLKSFGLSIIVDRKAAMTTAGQIALLTLVNLARRTFLAGVEVSGINNISVKTGLAECADLADAVTQLGGKVVEACHSDWPVALIGDAVSTEGHLPTWRLTWEGWRGGVVPSRDRWRLGDDDRMPLAPALAAATCAAEVFAFHAGDHPLAGRRSAGLSLWRPDRPWNEADETEPELSFLPSRLWLIGLGNLGQAYAWLLACLPYARGSAELVLQDYDRLAVSNDSTSMLSTLDGVDQMKSRWVSEWLEARGFTTFLEERRFGAWTARSADEPAVALCGVDNGPTRASLEKAGFELVIESGLGAGPQSFRSFSMHSFPGSRHADQIWSGVSAAAPDVADKPAYEDLKKAGMDDCGLAQLASRTVGVPFVGLIAASLVISELLRRLHGGMAFDVIAGSALTLDHLETSELAVGPYAYGHIAIQTFGERATSNLGFGA